MKRIAILGGGLAGTTAAYFLAQSGGAEATLFEATNRLGGTISTVHEGGFLLEGGPDGWVSEKPWAQQLADELGLETVFSQDEGRKTYIRLEGELHVMPDHMRMMVPADLAAVESSPLFTEAAKRAYREEPSRAAELRASAPDQDESVASFVERHFGREVLTRIAAPLLSGVFGGDVATLSARAVMPAFVAMEREYGSLVLAVQARARQAQKPIFTTLRNGLGELITRMTAAIPPRALRMNDTVRRLTRIPSGWLVDDEPFDAVFLATPAAAAQTLLAPTDKRAAELLQMEASSAVLVAFGFSTDFVLPPGFGILVPPGHGSLLMACTFMDQKFPRRVPPGGRLLRAFFGGAAAQRLTKCGNDEIAAIARMELARLLGPLPDPAVTVVRRLPNSLPQYAVGHLDRMAELEARTRALGNLWLLGNPYRGVGLPDLIRDARKAAQEAI